LVDTLKNWVRDGIEGEDLPRIGGGTAIGETAPERLNCLKGAVEWQPFTPRSLPQTDKQLWSSRTDFPGVGMRIQLYGFDSAASRRPSESRKSERDISSFAPVGSSKSS
jgi:hypothetical protein